MTDLSELTGKAAPAIDARLWMLISPALPVGGYSYSQGLEHAIGAGWIRDGADVLRWLDELLSSVLVPVDLASLLRLQRNMVAGNAAAVDAWNRKLIAARESLELRKEDLDMGRALTRLLMALESEQLPPLPEQPSLATAFAAAGVAFDLNIRTLLAAYAWVWCENQVAAAVKLVPLGQTAGQKILLELASRLEAATDRAINLDDEDMWAAAPGLAIAAAAHETQHTRLFRS